MAFLAVGISTMAIEARAGLLEPLLQNWLLQRFTAVLGPGDAVERFVGDYLGERRFEGLV